MRNRFSAAVLATVLGAGLLVGGVSGAQASEKGRKNTAILAGAVAIHQLLKGKTTNGVIAGAGAYYAYKRYKDARKGDRRSLRIFR